MNKFFTQAESNARGIRTHEETGRDGDGNPTGRIMVGFSSTEDRLGMVGGQIAQVSKEIVRLGDALPYAVGDLITGAQTKPHKLENAARVPGGNGTVIAARLVTSKRLLTPAVRVHLYRSDAIELPADNAPHKGTYADAAKRVGAFDLPALVSLLDSNSDASESIRTDLRIPFVCEQGSRDLYFALEARDIFMPGQLQKFYLFLLVDLN